MVRSYQFKIGCGDWLKLAADAADIRQANHFLEEGIRYIEKKNLTTGSSAYFIHTPSADVGLWYQRLKKRKEVIEEVIERDAKGESTPLEISNTLIKLRELLLDIEEDETKVTLPTKIWLFPYQLTFLFSYMISGIGSLIFWTLWIVLRVRRR